MTVPSKWLSKAGTNCYSCLTGKDVCSDPPKVLYHQYLDHLHDKHWQGNLLAFKSYLLTQASSEPLYAESDSSPFFKQNQQLFWLHEALLAARKHVGGHAVDTLRFSQPIHFARNGQ